MEYLNMLCFLTLLVAILLRAVKSEVDINAASLKLVDTTTTPPPTAIEDLNTSTSCVPICDKWRIKVKSMCPSYHEFEQELLNCTTILLANPINECTYYICAPLSLTSCGYTIGPVLKHCPRGTVFVPEKHRCDFKRDKFGRIICSNSCPTTKTPKTHCNGTIDESEEGEDLCTTGRRQSPIDLNIKAVVNVTLPALKWLGHGDSRPDGFDIKNTGETVELRYRGDAELPRIEGGGLNGTYQLEQVHFHWNQEFTGSEHDINGILYALEAHFVHFNKKYGNFTNSLKFHDGLAVTGFLFSETKENVTNFDGLISGLKTIRNAGESTQLAPNALAWLKPYLTPSSFFKYEGSLTTPPCSEIVTWIVMNQIGTIGIDQLQEFLKLLDEDGDKIVENSRIIQDINGRVLYFSP